MNKVDMLPAEILNEIHSRTSWKKKDIDKIIKYKNFTLVKKKRTIILFKENKFLNKIIAKLDIRKIYDNYIVLKNKFINLETGQLEKMHVKEIIQKGYNYINGRIVYSDVELCNVNNDNFLGKLLLTHNIKRNNKINNDTFGIIMNDVFYLCKETIIDFSKYKNILHLEKVIKNSIEMQNKIKMQHKVIKFESVL